MKGLLGTSTHCYGNETTVMTSLLPLLIANIISF